MRSTATFTLGNNFERLVLLGTGNINGTGNALGNGLTGNTGANILDGGAGIDSLIGGKGRDTLTGGLDSDRFKFAIGDSGQTTTTIDRITDMAIGAVNTGDRFDFTTLLTIGGSADATTANEAAVDQTTGVTTFNAGSGTTLADALNDIANRFSLTTNSVGEFAFFKVNNTGAFHLFVSDGVAGVTANDVVVQLTGITTIGSIDLTGGDMTILT